VSGQQASPTDLDHSKGVDARGDKAMGSSHEMTSHQQAVVRGTVHLRSKHASEVKSFRTHKRGDPMSRAPRRAIQPADLENSLLRE